MEMEKDKIVFKVRHSEFPAKLNLGLRSNGISSIEEVSLPYRRWQGSHPDSLYRVAADSGAGGSKLTRVFRLLRWPVALLAVCIALAAFVYFLMPDNFEPNSIVNGTYWEPVAAGVGLRGQATQNEKSKAHKDITNKPGAKTSEIDFYEADDDKDDIDSIMDALTNIKRGPPIPPVFPTHLTPEVQYGNEKADSEKRTPKLLDSSTSDDSTLKPHITQKPEKPLAIYFNDATAATTETITRSETLNDFSNYDQKQTSKKVEEPLVKTHPSAYKEYVVPAPKDFIIQTEDIPRQQGNNPALAYPPQVSEYYNHAPSIDDSSDVNFTSGHSKLFGISIEDAERMKSTTQSSLYNTRVSPTLPTWRDGDDTTTKKYPTNIYSDVQCRSTRMPLCLGVLPYDLAGAAVKIGDVEITSLMPQIEYLMATNCSDRIRHFVCALLEPECSPPPFPPKLPCHNLCSAIVDNCDGHIPRELIPAFNCKQYSHDNCVAAKTPCYSREFTCSDGSCIPRDWICDSRNDCAGGEDEQKCTQCDATEFKCGSGACILKRWLCDGYTDCPDGEDEGDGLCGPEHVRAPADRRGEPGEDAAGSAPAPAVRRPNKVPLGHRKPANRHSENDSSKELLVTSYSNNAFTLMRNFTPSPSRLTPYNRSSLRGPYARKHKKEESIEAVPEEVQEPENAEPNTTESATQGGIKTIFENESVEDVNMGDLGFLDDVEKEGKTADGKPNVSRPKQVQRMNLAPAPSIARPMRPAPPEVIAPEKFTKPRVQLNKATSNFAKVIDGAALLKKASMAAAEEAAELEKEPNNTSIETGAMPALSGGVGGGGAFGAGRQAWGGAHASPCPSGELRCVDGRCIALAQLCDGAIDCSDHADEDNCYT